MCDAVHFDPSNGKHYILGTFSSLRARQFPMKHPKLVWFLTLTDVTVGKHKLAISMGLPMDTPKRIVEREFESKSPLHRLNLINEIHGLSFDAPGSYAITIEIDDVPILVSPIMVGELGYEA